MSCFLACYEKLDGYMFELSVRLSPSSFPRRRDRRAIDALIADRAAGPADDSFVTLSTSVAAAAAAASSQKAAVKP
eukprot:SAG22_NODE_308_length_12662_cov_9.722063_3_plen_76_part_00